MTSFQELTYWSDKVVRVDTDSHPQISRLFLGIDINKVIQMITKTKNNKIKRQSAQEQWHDFGMYRIEHARKQVLRLVDAWIVKDTDKVYSIIEELMDAITDLPTCIEDGEALSK